ncbi:S-adenosylmethionine:tRNA ribosyltransferase-isomerase [Lewinella sp. W8]|uniref:S-adenosylmethionine:tRNA ribosyltransferase-isomerase n=1 Tax=Lewinella sp. W8 TaxID=2528208 RepID=UPI001068AE1D|nr:S-adenosylmethionine:tRNA ribosyltransferase-isomerase [Lewinella sp. W8]MTB49495.1 S-adenosylmethionine:tRNA ribosyltransferase-isomerase [Lewinella sp. W8]
MADSARSISIDDYDYDLPDDRIARYPLADRAAARQLHFKDGKISERPFGELPEVLPEGTLLIGNQTRVIHARLHFPIGEGKRPVEIFCLDPLAPHDYALSLGAVAQVQWKCLIGGNRRWKQGALELPLEVAGRPVTLRATRQERLDNAFSVTFSWESDQTISFGEVLAAAGTIPLPPYLGRQAEASDAQRYQTVFAKEEGSVAAPTAGLHFTPAVLEAIGRRGIRWRELTLHVGAGTFKPVSSETLGDHTMHREFFTVSRSLVASLAEQLAAGHPIVSVGTTSLRCLESLFYLGAKHFRGELTEVRGPVFVDQWVTEQDTLSAVSTSDALRSLLALMDNNQLEELSGYTQLLLTPATRLRVADGIITNFHQPRSTLLLLVATLVGDAWRNIYRYALDNDFRFLSYGDSSLLWKNR